MLKTTAEIAQLRGTASALAYEAETKVAEIARLKDQIAFLSVEVCQRRAGGGVAAGARR